ncbi:hypothetical protein ANN_09433 [Periplaneta americana]|uniref:Uncharacterized protein n=1 Tax=Periplaneta americana TaxID=6978 RepID=A0ABQ8TMT6_PERAM|nr:hypothetical protein ANN_09433 [Periplaneta americana]
MGKACYYSVEKLLSSSLLSKNLKFRIYKTVILPVVVYGCETWTLTSREEDVLRLFENEVLRKIFGAKRDEVTGEWRKLHNAELHALYSSPDIIRNIKSRYLSWQEFEPNGAIMYYDIVGPSDLCPFGAVVVLGKVNASTHPIPPVSLPLRQTAGRIGMLPNFRQTVSCVLNIAYNNGIEVRSTEFEIQDVYNSTLCNEPIMVLYRNADLTADSYGRAAERTGTSINTNLKQTDKEIRLYLVFCNEIQRSLNCHTQHAIKLPMYSSIEESISVMVKINIRGKKIRFDAGDRTQVLGSTYQALSPLSYAEVQCTAPDRWTSA